MPTKEEIAADILRNDPEIMGVLTGGVYTYQQIGVEGYRRGTGSPTNPAFDAKGQLKPTALVIEGNILPYGSVRSQKDKLTAVSQTLFIYYYEMRGTDQIVLAKQRAYELLEGVRLGKTFPIWFVSDSPPLPDMGPLLDSTTIRQDWMVVFMKKPD